MRTVIRGGEPVDLLTADEVGAVMDARLKDFYDREREIASARERERLRGVKRIEIFMPVSPAASSVFVGQSVGSNTGNGPEQGYVWSLRMVGITISGTGTLTVYKASTSGDTRRPIFYGGTGQPVQVATWSSDQARIRFGEGIYIVGSTTLASVFLSAWEVPAEREGELL